MRRRRPALTTGIAALVGLAGLFWWWNTRPTVLEVDAEPAADFPAAGFSHASFEALLARFVPSGRVNYDTWHADRAARAELDRYLAAVARWSPDNAPERFQSDADRLAYWLSAYNAFVIAAVLDRWPIASVTAVKAPVEVVKALGFFYTLRFVAGGKRYSLYDIERNKVIKPARDPRVHFVLNCGSGGCPLLREKLPTGAALEPYLADAAREFVGDPRNVSVDRERRRIELSAIFQMYEDEFVAEVRRHGLPSGRGVVAYVMMVADSKLRAELEAAADYQIAFRPYDWSINRAEPKAEARL